MSKAILEFDLSDPDDRLDHQRAVNADGLTFVLWEFLHNTRKEIEYTIEDREEKGETVTTDDVLDLVYEKLLDELERNNININKLT